jgi:hypothetical protein
VDFALESSGELNIEFVTFVLVCMPYKIWTVGCPIATGILHIQDSSTMVFFF